MIALAFIFFVGFFPVTLPSFPSPPECHAI